MPRYQPFLLRALSIAAICSLFAAACSQQAQDAAKTGSATVSAAADNGAARLDLPALRAAASRAVREQRLYSPAGDNAIEWYLALRERQPGDPALATTLLELEPYAVIATEQSLSRAEFDEANRLIALIARANPDASALPRLREMRLVAERNVAQAKSQQAAQDAAAAVELAPTGASLSASPLPAVPAAVPPGGTTPASTGQSPSRSAETPRVIAAAPAEPQAKPASSTPSSPAPGRVPALLRDRAPRYPVMALRRQVEGQVELAFTIKADGSVADVRVLSASPEGFFEEAAIATSRYWQFEALGRDTGSSRTIRFSLPKPAP